MTDDLTLFLEYSLQSTPPENKQLSLGTLPVEVAEYIRQQSGIDVTGYVLTVDVYAVRHIMKSHGNVEKEALRGQKAVSGDDFMLILEVV